MKARKVDGLDPDGTLADNAERIVRVRLDELCGFMPRAADPEEVVALHDMRIAAKRLRYILEVTGPCFGPYARTATKHGEGAAGPAGRDPRLRRADARDARRSPSGCSAEDAAALREAGGDAADLDPALLKQAPARARPRGRRRAQAYLRARRLLLFDRFLELWAELERKGFRARLEYARR